MSPFTVHMTICHRVQQTNSPPNYYIGECWVSVSVVILVCLSCVVGPVDRESLQMLMSLLHTLSC